MKPKTIEELEAVAESWRQKWEVQLERWMVAYKAKESARDRYYEACKEVEKAKKKLKQ